MNEMNEMKMNEWYKKNNRKKRKHHQTGERKQNGTTDDGIAESPSDIFLNLVDTTGGS